MKTSLGAAKPEVADRSSAWGWFSGNLVVPGLGSLAAGRRVGYLQLALSLTGFALTLIYAAPFLTWTLQNWKQLYNPDADTDPVQRLQEIWSVSRQVLLGIVLFAIGWGWSLTTSRSLLQSARANHSSAHSSPLAPLRPPVLAPEICPNTGWQRQGQVISRTFGFPDFPAAIRFVNAVADRAEAVQHHPDIDIRWNQVTLSLTTHATGGLTPIDFALARECDALYEGRK